MKYIIMCGSSKDDYPKQLLEILGEKIVLRTIRLLRAYGVDDIAISSNDSRFEGLGVPVLHHKNEYVEGQPGKTWLQAFYPMIEPVTYICGDVYFSENAIRTIVRTEVESIMFFASAPPFASNYIKPWAEPMAFKVMNPVLFFQKIKECHEYDLQGKFHRQAISWELWQVICGTTLDVIDYTNYVAINDYTCDIDDENEAKEFMEKVWGV